MHSQGKLWNHLIRERVRERTVTVGSGNTEPPYKEPEKEQNHETRLFHQTGPGKELGSWDQGYSTTIHVQRIGERTGTVGSGNIQFKN